MLCYLHCVFPALQFANDELKGAFADVIPQVAPLLEARTSRFGKCVAFVELQVVAGAVECHHFVQCRRIRATLPRHIWKIIKQKKESRKRPFINIRNWRAKTKGRKNDSSRIFTRGLTIKSHKKAFRIKSKKKKKANSFFWVSRTRGKMRADCCASINTQVLWE